MEKPNKIVVLVILVLAALYAGYARRGMLTEVVGAWLHGGSADPHAAPRKDVVSAQEFQFADTLSPDDPRYSAWVADERKRYLALLTRKPCDILVVPVQTLQLGFDRATRSLMTAQLAHAIGRASAACVVDPYLAARALGAGRRQLDAASIAALAQAVKAKQIVVTHAGHDRKGELTLTVEQQSPATTGAVSFGASRATYTTHWAADATPMDALDSLLPKMLAAIDAKWVLPATAPGDAGVFEWPDAPQGLLGADAGPLQAAQRFQAMAALAPQDDREAGELFEKSWLAAGDASDAPLQRRIRARALFHLGYRPAALKLLESDTDPPARLLRELLNGNLPQARDALAAVTPELDRVVGSLEVSDLEWSYRQRQTGDPLAAPMQALDARSAGWAVVAGPRALDPDAWSVAGNAPLVAYLTHAFPVTGFVAADSGGALVLRNPGPAADSTLQPIRYFKQALLDRAGSLCCEAFDLRPHEIDVQQWLQARALKNIENAFVFAFKVQGLPDQAAGLLDGWDAEYDGHPHLSAMRAAVYARLAEHAGAGGDRLKREAGVAAQRAVWWEQGWSDYSIAARGFTQVAFVQAYWTDFPPRDFSHGNHREVLPFATNDVGAFQEALLVEHDPERVTALRRELDHRFNGAPGAAQLRLPPPQDPSDEDAQLAYQKTLLDNDPGNDRVAQNYIRRLIRAGRNDDAAATAQAMQGLRATGDGNSVRASNNAEGIGDAFFWRGDLAHARTFFAIAAANADGSQASMVATLRLHQLDGDVGAMPQIARDRLRRYDDANAAYEYLCAAFAARADAGAFEQLDQAISRYKSQDVWDAAIVGQRIKPISDDDMRAWLGQARLRSQLIEGRLPALRVGLVWYLVDRPRFDGLQAFLADLEGTPRQTSEDGGRRVAIPMGELSRVVAPSRFAHTPRAAVPEDSPVPAPEVLFATALVAQQRGDDEAAVTAFDAYAATYPLERDDVQLTLVLPYFARSAARTGDKRQLGAFLDTIPAQQSDFDVELAKATLDGAAGRHDAALTHLRLAFLRRPQEDGEAFVSPFQYADTAIWLFEQTHDARYRNAALEWARTYQQIQPSAAWAYALEARYADDADARRVRAIGIADYLDVHSAWLSGVRPADLERGRAWMRAHNPFKQAAKAEATSHA